MASWDGDDGSDGSDSRPADFREEIGKAEPPPVTDEMISPRTSPGPVREPTSDGDVACRVCGEMNAQSASYCLSCGVSLAETPDSEPLPWEDLDPMPEPASFDPGEGLLDLGEMSEVTPLHPGGDEEAESENIPQPTRDPKETMRIVLWAILGIALLYLAYATFVQGSAEPEDTTTTTLLNQTELAFYGSSVGDIADTVASLSTSGSEINTAWDDRTQEYDTTLTSLRALESQAVALPGLLGDLAVPDTVGAVTHQKLVDSARTLSDAATEMVEGLQAPDTGEARQAALAKFKAAALEFDSLATLVVQEVTSATAPETEETEGSADDG